MEPNFLMLWAYGPIDRVGISFSPNFVSSKLIIIGLMLSSWEINSNVWIQTGRSLLPEVAALSTVLQPLWAIDPIVREQPMSYNNSSVA